MMLKWNITMISCRDQAGDCY